MSRLTIADFKRQFREVVGRGDRHVVVYSGIWTFGHRFGMAAQRVAYSLIEAMLEEMGSDQTLAFPAYTYDFARTRRYSPATSPPETGVIPNTVHQHFAHLRSKSALNSFLCIGPDAEKLVGLQGATLWGEGSIKAYFEASRARMVVLGLPWKDACGYLHRIEEVCGVPYRYHKTFDGTWVVGETTSTWSETMFVRPLEVLPIFQWQLVDDLLRRRGRVRSGAGEIFIESADAAELVEAGREILADDKLALIVNRAEIQNWIDFGKRGEIAALRASEPRALSYFDQLANENPLLLT